MALSNQRVVSDGALTTLDISFDYFDQSEIEVYFDSVGQPPGGGNWMWGSNRNILFIPAVPEGVEVLLQRKTDASGVRHEFSKGSAFRADTLDENFKQVLHIAQEAVESNFSKDFFDDINMNGHRILNLPVAQSPSEPVTLQQLQGITATRNTLRVYGTYAAASAAAATLPDGQVVDVAENNTRYDVSAGNLLNARPTTPLSVVAGIVRSVQDKLGKEFVSIPDFGAIGDGVLHLLSEKFSTLAMAQVVYPHATSLAQSIDWAALVSAMRSGADWVYAPKAHYMLNDTVPKADGVMVVGDGNDLWMPGVMDFQGWRLSDDHGTHFYFCGTGPKSYTINNLSNTSPSRTNEGTTYDFTDFTLRDSVAGAPATPKPFSVAWIVGRNSGIQNCRIIPSNNKLAGYLDRSVTTLSDDWDIGVWLLHPQDSYCFNVQSVGHWRMSGWLQTENDSGTATWTTSERANIEKCMGNGVRGLLIRHHPAYWVTANTADTVTVKWNPTFTLTRFPQARINGVISAYTGYTFNAGDNTVTLTGVSPPIVGNITGTSVRSAYSGNNLSNTIYKDCIFSTIDHNTYQPSEALGLPVAFAAEYDGYPLRNVVHINTVFQTRYDKGNTLWGHCQDFKYIGCKHENGALIAFDVAEAGPLHANNMRFIAEDSIWYDTQLWGFKPRSAIIDSYQNNQQGTDGAFYQRPLPGKRLALQNQASEEVLTTSATDGLVTLWNGAHTARIELPADGVGRIRMDTLRFLNAAGTEVGRITGAATTPTWELKGNVLATGYCRPATDNTYDVGGTVTRWRDGYITRVRPGAGAVIWTSGAGTPEGVVTAVVGSMYTRTDGGNGTTLYIKETGSGNTGWVAK